MTTRIEWQLAAMMLVLFAAIAPTQMLNIFKSAEVPARVSRIGRNNRRMQRQRR